MDEFEDPARGEVLRQEGKLGEGQREQTMELIDQPGALADDGLESPGDLAEGAGLQ